MADVCISTVGDRHALHSVYYSAMKKTAFRLPNCVFAACDAHRNVGDGVRAQHKRVRCECAANARWHFAQHTKSVME
jgi:hypothetical protein